MRSIGLAVLGLTLVATPAHAGFMHKAKRVLQRDTLRTRAAVVGIAMKAVGYAELAGVRIPVKPYQAQVTPTLWRGSRVDHVGLADLKRRGFSAVVGLTAERDLDAQARAVGLSHMRIPIIDNHNPTLVQVKTFLDFMKTQQKKGAVYVHCEAGIGRTGIMVAAYRMKFEGWDTGRALVEARKYGLAERGQVLFIRELGKVIDLM
ncbi:MAG: dual specificity protein phosphatase family protein [Polyangia bacterium]